MFFLSVRGYGKLQNVVREKSENSEVDDKWQPCTRIALSSVQENTCISLNSENETNNASTTIMIGSTN